MRRKDLGRSTDLVASRTCNDPDPAQGSATPPLLSFFTLRRPRDSHTNVCIRRKRANASVRARALALSLLYVHTYMRSTRINALAHGRTSNPSSFAYLLLAPCKSVRCPSTNGTPHTPHTPLLTRAPSNHDHRIERTARNTGAGSNAQTCTNTATHSGTE